MAGKQLSANNILIASESERAKLEAQRQQEQKETILLVSEQARGLINQNKSDVIKT